MNAKLSVLNNILSKAEEKKTKLRIESFKGVYECLLLNKISSEDGKIKSIKVRTLDNEHPEYKEGLEMEVNLLEGGLIQIHIVS